MAKITFFEKTGCINNTKQKKILERGGHELECLSILEYPWTTRELLPFVNGKEVHEIMNFTAPEIKDGTIDPEKLSFDEAVNLMVKKPILIKRPLIIVENTFIQGFTAPELQPFISHWDGTEDVITCPNLNTVNCDEQKKTAASKLTCQRR